MSSIWKEYPSLRTRYDTATRRPELYEALAGEFGAARESAAQAGRTGSLGDRPVAVVTAGDSYAPYGELGIPVEASNRVWRELQAELLDLSTNSRQWVAPDATHQIDIDAPDLVVEATKWVVGSVRRGT